MVGSSLQSMGAVMARQVATAGRVAWLVGGNCQLVPDLAPDSTRVAWCRPDALQWQLVADLSDAPLERFKILSKQMRM